MSTIYTTHGKRLLDIIISLLGIVVLCVPMLLIALLIRVDSHGSIIFKQKRSGKAHEPFYIYKFRTMPLCAPDYVVSIDLEQMSWNLTPFQKFLRKTSLDELPQLFNIIKGEMSFIGPRPVIFNAASLLEEREKYGINDMRPGLSGWAQIHGRDNTDDKAKVSLDKWYMENICLLLDVKIFFRSFLEIPRYDGV